LLTTFRLSDIVSPAFKDPHRAFKEKTHNQLVLRGGRASGKSSFASIEGILILIKSPDTHGVVIRKVGNTLRTSVYAQYLWAVSALGLHDKFKGTVSPMELIYKPTGQKIMFMGADDPGKLKSLKVPFGYIAYLHFEELDQFAGEDEVRNIEQSVLRGGPLAYEIKSFNPPRTNDNWANKYCLVDKPGQLIHTSSYLTTPQEWLGERFLNDAEYLREINYPAYEHEYLGIPNGTGGNVFDNVTIRPITDDETFVFDRCYYGIDWGWYPDPFHFVECAYTASTHTLYIYGEQRYNKKSNEALAGDLDQYRHCRITADSGGEGPKSIDDFRARGFNMRGAIKGPGSVEYSMKWLASLKSIIIDGNRCPYAAKEFVDYEYERDKDGNVISGYPDANNHAIDAVRYAMEETWRRRGQ